jgi:CarboxypepD_reg-like domain
MKTFSRISLFISIFLLAFTSQNVFSGSLTVKKNTDQQGNITIKGKVIDAENRDPLIFASVSVKESNVAIVTNIDGEFTLKIAESENLKNLEISFLGYKNITIPISEMRVNGYKNVISLEPAPIPIKGINVKPIDPEYIVEKAINLVGRNYESKSNLMTAFYRETIRKNRTYVAIGESVVEIYKAPYANDIRFDAIRIYKGRKGSDVQKMDTVLFKLQGGMKNALELDIAKNRESILTAEAMKNYNYSLTSVIEIDNKSHYVIDFIQKPSVEMPLFLGTLYIEMETFAITEIVFGFNLSDKEAASSIFIKKKPFGMKVTPEIATYRTKYREQDGKWYFSYSRTEVSFKANWKKKLFNTNYTIMSEIAVTDRTDQEVIKFAGKEKARFTDVFSEEVSAFTDKEFWGDYNIIEPDQSIESAIRRLSRKLKFSDREENK